MNTRFGTPVQNPVTVSFVESLVSRMLVQPLLFEEVRTILQPAHFSKPEEKHLQMLYRAMLKVHEQFSGFTQETLRMECERLNCDEPLPDFLRATLLGEPTGILCWTFTDGLAQVSAVPLAQSREMFRRFLQERAVYAPLQLELANGMPQNLQPVLEQAAQQWQRVLQIDSDPISAGTPDGRGTVPLNIRSTGLAFLDVYMDGGHADTEAYGLIGPTGVGKTATACQIASAALDQEQQKLLAQPGYVPRRVYYVSYEASRDEIKQRVVSSLCDISRDSCKLIDFGGTDLPESLSSSSRGDYKPYELELSVPPGAILPGERERYLNKLPLLRDYLRVVDLSGLGDKRYTREGIGGIEEVISLVAMDQARLGNPGVALVVIDYVLLAVERYLDAQNLDKTKHLRFAVPAYVDAARQRIAGRFITPIWLLQQFNTTGNKKSPATPQSHTDAAEAGSKFANPLVFCATLGTKDEESGCTLMSFSKRRRAGNAVPARVMRIDPTFHKLYDATNDFVAVRATGRIVARRFASQVMGPAAAAAPNYSASGDNDLRAVV